MSFAAQSSSESHEPSILEYARYHGLSCDSVDDNDEELDLNLVGAASLSHDQNDPDMYTDSVVDTGLLDEKLILNAEARVVLASIVHSQRPSESYPPELDIRHTKNIRLANPLLLTDPELDVKQYLEARVSSQKEVDINLDKFPLFTTNEENEQGLAWPEKYHTLLSEYEKHIADERVRVPKEGLLFLHKVCLWQNTHEHIHERMESELKYKRVCHI